MNQLISQLQMIDWGIALGVISVILGCISIWLTLKTFRKAKEIDAQINQEKVDALDKNKFNDDRGYIETELLQIEKQLMELEANGLDYKTAKCIFNQICNIARYNVLFSYEDQQLLIEKKDKQKEICENIRQNISNDYQIECIETISTLKQILQKGSYRI